jgi:hypothetical protein
MDTRFCFFGGGVREGELRGVALREGGAALADLDLVLLGPVLAVPPFLKAAMSWVASSSELMLLTWIMWFDAFTCTVVVGVQWLYERMIEQLRCGAERLLNGLDDGFSRCCCKLKEKQKRQ